MKPQKQPPAQADNKTVSENVVVFGAGQLGATSSYRHAAATDAAIDGMDAFLDMFARTKDKIPHLQEGHLFEAIVACKENVAAAEAGILERTSVTHLTGDHRAPADLQRRIRNKVVAEAQAKFSHAKAEDVAEMLADPKYQGMDRYIPAQGVQTVDAALREKAAKCTDPAKKALYLDAAKNLVSHDTRGAEIRLARRAPKLYAARQELKQLGTEAAAAGVYATASAAVVGGGISIVKNAYKAFKGEITTDEAMKAVSKDTSRAAVHGGATGSGGSLIRYAARKVGSSTFSKSNVAAAIAASVIEAGVTIWKFADGELSAEQAMEQLGQNDTSTVSSIYVGAAAGTSFGPVGVVVGSLAGYIVASSVYQSCVTILWNARLAEEEAARIESICEASVKRIEAEQREFERLLEEQLALSRHEFNRFFDALDTAYRNEDYSASLNALAGLASLFGKRLKFQTFEEFDDFMSYSGNPLTL